MIVVTGAVGFIGSCLVKALNNAGHQNIIVVDDFSNAEKNKNLEGKSFAHKVDRKVFADTWFFEHMSEIEFVFHIGARTDTTTNDIDILEELNYNYTRKLWAICSAAKIPIVYASSAATYGLGEHGYDDDHLNSFLLKPLNAYGESKNDFDKWAISQNKKPPYWIGLKFFNVYGPNEYHKGRMASVIFHAFNQVKEKGSVNLFKSHHPNFANGEQLRDFVYVKDVLKVCLFLYKNQIKNGIYNLGTGKANTFLSLAKNTFAASKKPENIGFIDTPIDIRDKYQYFTEAKMEKLIGQGYTEKFYTLEEGINDYVKNYLSPHLYF